MPLNCAEIYIMCMVHGGKFVMFYHNKFFTNNVYSCLNLPCFFFLKIACQNTIKVTDSKFGGSRKAHASPWTSWLHLKKQVQRTKSDLPLTCSLRTPVNPKCHKLEWPKSSLGFFHNILQENPNDLFGQTN